jgi:hypothetical protein
MEENDSSVEMTEKSEDEFGSKDAIMFKIKSNNQQLIEKENRL